MWNKKVEWMIEPVMIRPPAGSQTVHILNRKNKMLSSPELVVV